MTGNADKKKKPTLGSLFAGIGGFDLGFERAGFRTAWQVEIDGLKRAVLAERFPAAKRYGDIRECGEKNLAPVDCITAGFPCQDISTSGSSNGKRPGLRGARSGLFYEVVRIVREIRPQWLVLENVPALLHSNDCADIETVIRSLADSGYMGCFRVLDAQYFGVPQKRRRIFLVARAGQVPPLEFLADAGQLESLSCSGGAIAESRKADTWACHTLLAQKSPGQFCLGSQLFIAHEDAWHQMRERARGNRDHGIPKGLDDENFAQSHCAGNAVVPQITEWIALKIMNAL